MRPPGPDAASPGPARGWLPSALALAALLLVLFRDVVFRGRILFERDLYIVYWGQVEALVRCVATGSWPLWNPYASFGQPFLANPSAQVLYPWTWLNLLGLPGPVYAAYALGHLLLAGCGLGLLARRMGLSRGAAFLAAAVWMLSGPILSMVSLWHHLAGAAWMPWVLLALEGLLSRPSAAGGLLWGAAHAGQIFTGSADMCAMTAAWEAIRILGHLYLRGRPLRSPGSVRLAAAGALGVAFALALSAAEWAPAIEVARRSARWGLPAAFRTEWSVSPLNLLQTLLPAFHFDAPVGAGFWRSVFGADEPFLNSLYLGLSALPLVVAALCGGSRTARFLALMGGGAALVALGPHGPVYGLLLRVFPALAMLRYPSKAMIPVALAWALLAGLGYDALRSREKHGERRAGLALACALVAAMAVLGGTALGRERLPAPTVVNLAVAGGATLLVAGAIAILRGHGSGVALGWSGLAAVVVVDLLLVHRALNPTADPGDFKAPPPIVAALRAGGPARIAFYDYKSRVQGVTYRRPPNEEIFVYLPRDRLAMARAQAACLSPLLARRWGLFGSYEQDVLGLFPRQMDSLSWVYRAAQDAPAHLRLLQVGSVEYFVAFHSQGLEGLLPVAAFPCPTSGSVYVFRVPGALPRSYVVGGVRVADGPAVYRILVDPGFDPAREVVLPEGRSAPPPAAFGGSSRIVEYRPDRVVVDASLEGPGHVVLTDAFDPGWRVTVDGRAGTVLRANAVFRAVAVPAGLHRLEFLYRPSAVSLGLAASGAALVAGMAWGAHALRAARGGGEL